MGLKAYRQTWRKVREMNNRDSKLVNDAEIGNRCVELLKKPLTETEKMYVDSFLKYFKKKNALTIKQNDFLKTIETRYSDERIAASTDWINNWDDEKRKRLDLAFEFYKNTHYFRDLVQRIARTPDYIPTENQYKSFCYNKYVTKAIENYNKPPKYNLADLVVFRASKGKYYDADNELIGMIEDISEKGSFYNAGRTYRMMILGTPDFFTVQESDIKPYKEKKNV